MTQTSFQIAESIEQEIVNGKISTKSVMFGGDGAVGKTSMFLYYFRDAKEPQYIPIKVDTDYGPRIYTYKKGGKKVGIYYDDHEGGGEDWHRLFVILVMRGLMLWFSGVVGKFFWRGQSQNF